MRIVWQCDCSFTSMNHSHCSHNAVFSSRQLFFSDHVGVHYIGLINRIMDIVISVSMLLAWLKTRFKLFQTFSSRTYFQLPTAPKDIYHQISYACTHVKHLCGNGFSEVLSKLTRSHKVFELS